MTTPSGPITIYVDADACPVKQEIYRVAERHGLKVFVVSNSPIAIPRDPLIERIVVAAGMDAADNWIAERAAKGAVVITQDIPLAARAVKAGAVAIAPNGKPFTEDTIGMALATRNLLDSLRSAGEVTGGPRAFSLRAGGIVSITFGLPVGARDGLFCVFAGSRLTVMNKPLGPM